MVETALISFLIGVQLAGPRPPVYRVERDPVGGGSELVTLFEHSPGAAAGAESPEIPLVTVLRDTLGSDDPDDVRLRYVWILTNTRPTLLQRTASALSFVWFRTGGKEHADRVPSPVMDLASPSKTVWSHLAASSLQALQFDGLGIPIRSSTRSYRGNLSDYRQLQIYRALGALNAVENQTGNGAAWPKAEFVDVFSRLSLTDRTFGGLVRQENLSKVYNKETSRRAEIRGHNWELLRQRAEANGVYFDPLALPDQTPSHAMLWIARTDLESGPRSFDRKFLGIADPWNDERLEHWTGYTETRYFDKEGRPVSAGAPGARAVEMIPLALYSLDYPRVPLLLVDFRSSMTAKKRELLGHLSTAVLTGVLGITTFGNFTFLAANSSWTLYQGRHGSPTNRSERLRSYSEAREFLAVDTLLAPALKTELERRLDHLALNPLENAAATEARVAREQYAALLQWSQSPNGLAAKLEKDRQKELAAYTHSKPQQMFAGFEGLFKGGSVRSESDRETRRAELESRRQADAHTRYLKQLLASSPRPEIVRDPSEIRNNIEALSSDPFVGPEAPALVGQVFERTRDFDVRMACLDGLGRMHLDQAKNELMRLAQNPEESDFWRAASRASIQSTPDVSAAGAGQF